MRDFTLETFKLLLQELKAQGYTFQTFRDFLKAPAPKAIVLRHDVDARKLNSLQTARLEAELGITGTYYFRMVLQSYDVDVIRQIAELGHEIGYHYEDLAMAGKKRQETRDKRQGRSKEEWLYYVALRSFESNLEKLRQVAPVATICMHGSPLSRYDNRKLWEQCDYRKYDIVGEPYFDVDFSKVMYLTDTGRRWDGERVSIRDKVKISGDQESKLKDQKEDSKSTIPLRRGQGEDLKAPSFHSTFDIIHAAKSGLIPAQLMITVHPQRWDNRVLPWIKELILQRVKNRIKGIIADLQLNHDHKFASNFLIR